MVNKAQITPQRGLNRFVLAVLSVFTLAAGTACSAGDPTEVGAEESASAEVQAAGSCSKYTESSGHTGVGKCSGYQNTGTFRITAICCSSHCDNGRKAGNWAFLAGGTSKVSCGSAYATSLQIQQGPPGG